MSDAVQAVSQFMQPINQGIEAIAPVAGIASAIPGMARQWGIQGQLMQPGVPKIPPQVYENIREAVGGGSMSAYGSAAPALTARGESSALADWLLNFMGLRNQALSAAAGMNQGGDLASMIAAATGGLGGQYAQTSQTPWMTPGSDVLGTVPDQTAGAADALGRLWQAGGFTGA